MYPNANLQSVEYDRDAEIYRVEYDEETLPSVAVPAAMQEITQTEIRNMVPMHAVIDPEALDELFRRPRSIAPAREGRVTFRYQGHTVTVFDDQRLHVEKKDD